ncbi:unnamed protein product [Lupinus luteus]|uniref:non-specific serine/threonine protein kinase n=1 Tax=Lupinus luteus TaxID=3873 RepID=A0AAV1XRV6_LUPLU
MIPLSATTIAFFLTTAIALTTTTAASNLLASLLNEEANALLSSRWWSGQDITKHCNWSGIVCNEAGSITAISTPWNYSLSGHCLWDINVTAFPNLVHLDLSEMQICGEIPAEIGGLMKLAHLDLSHNYFTGQVPITIANLSQLVMLDVSYNYMSGGTPQELGVLKKLVTLDLSVNNFIGTIPSSLSQMTSLTHMNLSSNKLDGELPSTLVNLTQLVMFDVSYNSIHGGIPYQFSSLMGLMHLNLSCNQLSGELPTTIANLAQLVAFNVSFNSIVGVIPQELGNLKNLVTMDLSGNKFNGSIPSSLGNLIQLQNLDLSQNDISGSIPLEIEHLINLKFLDLSNNKISGVIPEQLFANLTLLQNLHLSHNNITGLIPSWIGKLYKLQVLNISHNRLEGSIPLGILIHCNYVQLSYNSLNGSIPTQIGNLTYLDLSYNNLVGQIPEALESVSHMDLSYNSFDDTCCHFCASRYGHEMLIGNNNERPGHLCKSIAPFFNLTEQIVIYIAIGCLICACCIGGGHYIYRDRHGKFENKDRRTIRNGDLFSIWNYDGKIAFEDILKATEDFDIKYCIGTGAYGSVYKAQLPSGKCVALKKLHKTESENESFYRSFCNEVKVLTDIRHRNIIRLYGFCLHNKCMFLVYEYMERGSLFYNLVSDIEAEELNWRKRVTIIKDIAYALAHMHHHCTPPILHRDISSNNILLNSELQAFVSDFGAARLLYHDSSNQTLVVGTFGYIAPETMMGTHPRELISCLSKPYTQNMMVKDILDARSSLPSLRKDMQDVVLVLTLALACLRPHPKSRPSMQQVANEFSVSKGPMHFNLCDISINQLKNEEIYAIR